MRALITGAAGFAGSVLRTHLEAEGDEVEGWSRSTGGPDITDRAAVFSEVKRADADVIYHLAAQSHVPTAWEDPISTIRTNVEGTQNVLDAALDASNVRVVVITSAEVYGAVTPDQLPITEETALSPSNPYAASKAAADAFASSAHAAGLDLVRMRPFNHFGPGQSTNFASSGFAHRIAAAVLTGKDSIPVGRLDITRDFCDVRDVVRAYRAAAVSGKSGSIYNVCSGVGRSIQELADALVAASGTDIELVESPDLVRPVDTPVVVGSAARLADMTGWAPTISFEQSMRDIYDDAAQNVSTATA